MPQDYYAELGVPRDADDKQVKAAFRRLARRYHPDVNTSDADAGARFKRVNEAYQVLSDKKTRRDYDEFGDNWKHADQMRASGGFQSAPGGRRGFGGMGLGDLFGDIGFGAAFGGPRRQSLRTNAQISLEEAYAGSKRVITIQGSMSCPSCQGTGVDGTVLCPNCGGSGMSAQPRTLEVTIPKGTESGDRIRVRPDDLTEVTIEVNVRRHRTFTRKGDDLTTEASVSYLDALLGGEVELPTMTGRVALTVPPGTVEGRSFRITGKGMPRHGRGAVGYGDLVAKVVISVPKDLTEQEEILLKKLRDLETSANEDESGGVSGSDEAPGDAEAAGTARTAEDAGAKGTAEAAGGDA